MVDHFMVMFKGGKFRNLEGHDLGLTRFKTTLAVPGLKVNIIGLVE